MESLENQLDVLRKAFVSQLQQKVLQMEQAWRSLDGKPTNTAALEELLLLAHRLAGSGTTFGFPAVGTAARALELQVRALRESPASSESGDHSQIEQSLRMLNMLAEELAASSSARSAAQQAATDVSRPMGEPRLIYLVSRDKLMADDLALHVEPFGYELHVFQDLQKLRQVARKVPPKVIIVDVIFPDDTLTDSSRLSEIRQSFSPGLPMVVIAARDDLVARLLAVRAGCDAYFVKPVDFGALIDKLDDLTSYEPAAPLRVLIVDDDPQAAGAYAATLVNAGMLAEVVTNPLQLLQPLHEFRPDLILMDLYMPGCTGLELGKVIRQQPAYVGVPIVFLSTETDLDKQLAAMEIGGDDFLNKAIKPQQLITAVTSRARRSLELRSLMTTDSLTGLLNHTAFKERLEVEVARSRRLSEPLALALIDLDHFKLVNDTYGHPTGDRVLRSLSRLLQQRLRKSDAIGRYGGEEFGMILPGTGAEMAMRLLQELRISFAQVRHPAEYGDFCVTFSCGIATFPEQRDIISLNDAADKALYEAKRSGRDRVVLAEPGGRTR